MGRSILGLMGGAVGATYETLTWRGAQSSTADGTSYSFPSSPIGTADPLRVVIVALALGVSGSAISNSVVINGVSATKINSRSATGCEASIWAAQVPDGVGNVTITVGTSGNANACIMGHWTVLMSSLVTSDTATGAFGTSEDNLVVSGFVIVTDAFGIGVFALNDPVGGNEMMTADMVQMASLTVDSNNVHGEFYQLETPESGVNFSLLDMPTSGDAMVLVAWKGNGTT